MKWRKWEWYYDTEDGKYQIWHNGKDWWLEQAQTYLRCELYIYDVYRVIGKFHTLKQAKDFAEWYEN